jgi:hypothetical protein
MKYICEICSEEFNTFSEKGNHIRWKHKDNTIFLNKISKISEKTNEKIHGKWIYEECKCSNPKCEIRYEIKFRENKRKNKNFCSMSCANSGRIISSEKKIKIGEDIKKMWKEGKYSELDFSRNKRFSSKREREIVKHFKEKFPYDGWKSGGHIKNNGIGIIRDLYSDKLKTCFEYDGIWHFKDIHGQLERKQKVDKELEDWCIKNNYRLIRLQEEYFENLSQVEELIYNTETPIIKIGNKY